MLNFISLLPLVIYIIILPILPNIIPVHYNINLQPDQYASKYVSLLMALIPPITLYLVTLFSKKDTNNTEFIKKITHYILLIFLNIITIAFLLILLNPKFFILINISISLLFISLGFLFPHIKQNNYIGVRTKITLTNKNVWNKIHNNCKLPFILLGILSLIINNLLITALLLLVLIIYIHLKIRRTR